MRTKPGHEILRAVTVAAELGVTPPRLRQLVLEKRIRPAVGIFFDRRGVERAKRALLHRRTLRRVGRPSIGKVRTVQSQQVKRNEEVAKVR